MGPQTPCPWCLGHTGVSMVQTFTHQLRWDCCGTVPTHDIYASLHTASSPPPHPPHRRCTSRCCDTPPLARCTPGCTGTPPSPSGPTPPAPGALRVRGRGHGADTFGHAPTTTSATCPPLSFNSSPYQNAGDAVGTRRAGGIVTVHARNPRSGDISTRTRKNLRPHSQTRRTHRFGWSRDGAGRHNRFPHWARTGQTGGNLTDPPAHATRCAANRCARDSPPTRDAGGLQRPRQPRAPSLPHLCPMAYHPRLSALNADNVNRCARGLARAGGKLPPPHFAPHTLRRLAHTRHTTTYGVATR